VIDVATVMIGLAAALWYVRMISIQAVSESAEPEDKGWRGLKGEGIDWLFV
jgi:hypothetical protein